MANVLSEENAVLAEENAFRAEENAVQAGEIARLRGLLETHTSHGNQRVSHEKVLEPKDIVDHSSHGTLCSLLPTSTPFHFANGTNCLWLALELTAVADHSTAAI